MKKKRRRSCRCGSKVMKGSTLCKDCLAGMAAAVMH